MSQLPHRAILHRIAAPFQHGPIRANPHGPERRPTWHAYCSSKTTMSGDREKAIAAGCDDYHAKPVDFSRLLGQIDALVGRVPAGG